MIKILIADDHPIFRETLARYLSEEASIQIVGELGDATALPETIAQLQPDVLLLDINMPGPSALDIVKTLKNKQSDVQVVVLTASKKSEHVVDLLQAGINGYVLKEDSPQDLLQAIESVAEGKEWFSTGITKVLSSSIRLQGHKSRVDLTERETDVLRLMVKGVNNDEIAEQLFIAPNTVRNHVRNIFRKLEVGTRVEAVVYALDNHLVD